jgi:hypothetical protein
MEDGRIPKDILYGELSSWKRCTGHPKLWYKDVVKRDMKALGFAGLAMYATWRMEEFQKTSYMESCHLGSDALGIQSCGTKT